MQAEAGVPWVALSYVWGHSSGDAGPEVFPQALPNTIEDAIKVTEEMGYRYLWVDRYCIDQKEEAQKLDLIAKMDIIYRAADLTIIAAAGLDEVLGCRELGAENGKSKRSSS